MNSTRTSAAARAQQILAGQPIFLDTETTGLDPRAEIVEIALIDHDGAVLLESLVKPTRPIPQDATRIHRITDGMVADAPTAGEVSAGVQALPGGRGGGVDSAQ